MDLLQNYESSEEGDKKKNLKLSRKRKRTSSSKSNFSSQSHISASQLSPPRLSIETDRFLSHIFLPVHFEKCSSKFILQLFFQEKEKLCQRENDKDIDNLTKEDDAVSCIACENRWKEEGVKREWEIIPTPLLHVSVSKTFILEKNQIKPFVSTLESFLTVCAPFSLEFDQNGWFENESKEKKFFAFLATKANQKLEAIISSVDGVLEKFMKERYYSQPQVHSHPTFFLFLFVFAHCKLLLTSHLDSYFPFFCGKYETH